MSKTTTMPRRELLQLANKLTPKHKIGGWYASEKLDGTRCYWDGGVSRNRATEDVPWASIHHPKTGQLKKDIKPVATGLWSRYGNPIIAPEWFLDRLPNIPLDGELFAGRGNFQLLRSIVAGNTPDPRWDRVEFLVFGSPPNGQFLKPGLIKNANMAREIRKGLACDWQPPALPDDSPFELELEFLRRNETGFKLVPQERLPGDEHKARERLEGLLNTVTRAGGEGVMLRNPHSVWEPKRTNNLLKYKPYHDDEAVLVGFTAGRETDKGSRLLGKIGALIVEYRGKRLELSGLNDEEREIICPLAKSYAIEHPGEDIDNYYIRNVSAHFKHGQSVTFRYRELTDAGIPREAFYHRTRDED